MVWKIEYLKSIQKEVRKIDRKEQKRIKKYLRDGHDSVQIDQTGPAGIRVGKFRVVFK